MPLAFPDFRGATRKLVLSNLAAYFALLLLTYTLLPLWAKAAWNPLSFSSGAFLHGALWQPFTYSFIHLGILRTLFELLSLCFWPDFLETYHRLDWVTGLYCASVLGTAAAALAIMLCGQALGYPLAGDPLTGCFGGIFGLLAAIGVLYGDVRVPALSSAHRHQGPLPGGHLRARLHRHALRLSSACTPLPSWAARWPGCFISAWRRAAASRSA